MNETESLENGKENTMYLWGWRKNIEWVGESFGSDDDGWVREREREREREYVCERKRENFSNVVH